jgi:hypothetical protein
MSNLELPSSKKQEMFVGVGDDGAACEKLELKQKSRFSLHLHSIIDRIVPKFCRDEFCSGDMDDTFSVSSFEDSSESALLNPIHPEALAEDEDAMDTKGEYVLCCNVLIHRRQRVAIHHILIIT